MVKIPPANAGDAVWEDPLEKEMATHSRILAWKIPWTEDSDGLQSMGSQRVQHDWAAKHIACMHVKLLQLCPTLCAPLGYSQPNVSVRGIFQARIREWVAISSSRGCSQARDQTCISYISCIGRWVLYH